VLLAPFDRRDAWTLDDLADLPHDGLRYEVVDGALVVTPPPTVVHEDVARRLFLALVRQAPDGLEAVTESALRLGTDGRVPDVGVIRAGAPVRRRQVGRPADQWVLAVEVVSHSSRKTDRFFKPIEYAQAGIPAYWRVETEPEPLLVVHQLVGDRYDVVQELTGRGVAEVPFRVELDLPSLLPPIED
jgi:Uma2 family endonuclease